MEKFTQFIKKYRMEIIFIAVSLVVGILALCIILMANNAAKVVKVERDDFILQYDSSWKIQQESADEITLKHGDEAEVKIQISELADEYRFLSMEDLIDELARGIQEQNPDYKLLSKRAVRLTKNQYEGYKLLYEAGDEQVMVALYKQGDRLIVIDYVAQSEYFDILLDSVNSIIDNFAIKERSFNLSDSLSLKLAEAKYAESGDLDAKLGDTKTYEIARQNYLVHYTLPASFERTELNSTWGYFVLPLEGAQMNLSVDILNRNIYEYLDQEEITGVYQKYQSCQEKNECQDFQETLTRREGNLLSYVYKNSYKKEAVRYDAGEKEEYLRQDENVELLYVLDNLHVLKIEIEAKGVPITQKLVDEIKVEDVRNYASYITVEKADGYLLGELKKFASSERDAVNVVQLRVPEKYVELDLGDNIYTDRHYGWNYDTEMQMYDYTVHYGFTNLAGETVIKNINSAEMKSTYGPVRELSLAGNVQLGGKNFKLYTGGYTDISGIMFTDTNRKKYYVNKNVLIYEIPDKGTLYIEIDGNGKEISRENLEELANFVIKEEKY